MELTQKNTNGSHLQGDFQANGPTGVDPLLGILPFFNGKGPIIHMTTANGPKF